MKSNSSTLFTALAASSWLLAGSTLHAQVILFADTFDRDNSTVQDGSDLNTTGTGKSGTLGALTWAGTVLPASSVVDIFNNTLRIDSGTSNGAEGGFAYISDHNFIDAEIKTAGTFSVSVDITESSSAGNGRTPGFGIGQSLSDLTDKTSVSATQITADVYVAYDNFGATRGIHIYHNSEDQGYTSFTASIPDTLMVVFTFDDMNAGTALNYEVFLDGLFITSGTSAWGATDENYIHLQSNNTNNHRFDNLVIAIPEEDVTGPMVEATSPADDATGVVATTNLVATFDELVELGATGTITIKNLTNPGDLEISLPGADPDGTVVVSNFDLMIDPAVALVPGDEYAIEISAGALVDLAGNPFDGLLATDDPNWSFTIDNTSPVASGMLPMADATGVVPSGALTLNFDEDVQFGTGNVVIYRANDDSEVETIDVTAGGVVVSGLEVTISPSVVLDYVTAYYVQVSAGSFSDLSGNAFGGIDDKTTWAFTTLAFDPTLLFADSFGRADDTDLNAGDSGQYGILAPLTYGELNFNGVAEIAGGQLRLRSTPAANGEYGGVAYIADHNFIDSVIAAGGGFSITVDVAAYSTAGSGRQLNVGVGQSLAELEGQPGAAAPNTVADLNVAYRNTTDTLEIWKNGSKDDAETVVGGLPDAPTTMRIEYAVPNFNAGSAVTYEVYFDNSATPMASGSFVWSGTDENHISMSANLTTDNSLLDNLQVRANAVATPLQVNISQSGGALNFAWNGLSGKQYDLVSSTDLNTDPATWLPYNDGSTTYEDILSTGSGTNTLTGVQTDGAVRFFALVEEDVEPLFSEDFEDFAAAESDFLTSEGAGTPWAHGDPDSVGFAGQAVTTGNGGVGECWGTGIGNPGSYEDPTTDSCLRSSVIDLTGVAGATLSFAQALDFPAEDTAVVRIIDVLTGNSIETAPFPLEVTDGDPNNADWSMTGPYPLPVGGQIRIEWCFSGNGGSTDDYMGWYIDDVVVTPVTP